MTKPLENTMMEPCKTARPKMLVLAIDVGGPEKIGWACSNNQTGSGGDLDSALRDVAQALGQGVPVALGFEAPIWTPRREDLKRITSRRLGVEVKFNRAWSAGAGCGALGAALGCRSFGESIWKSAPD